MKDKKKLLLALAIVPLIAVGVTACGTITSSSFGGSSTSSSSGSNSQGSATSDSSTSEDSQEELEDATIYDAYEDTRPNYEDIFDYDSDYEPEPLPDQDAEFVLSFREDSPVRFADGSLQKSIKVNSSVTIEDFDLSQVTEGKTLGGFAVVGADGSIGQPIDIESFAMPRENTTIVPYFVMEGYTHLTYSSGSSNHAFNSDGVPGGFTSSGASIEHGLLVEGEGGYYYDGSVITKTNRVDEAVAFRTDTNASGIISQGGIYEVYVTYSNLGDTAIHLNAYQINASSEYKNGNYAYESRYRVDIDLEPGESMEVAAQYNFANSNNNILNYFVADQTMENGFVMGTSISLRARTDLTEVETVSDPEERPTTPIYPSVITMREDSPLKFADGQTTIEKDSGSKFTLEDFENNGVYNDRTVGGIGFVNPNGTLSYSHSLDEYTVGSDDMTIVPYFNAPSEYTDVALNSGRSNKDQVNLSNCTGTWASKQSGPILTTNEMVYDGALYTSGITLRDSDSILRGSDFRIDSAYDVEDNKVYEFYYSFENRNDYPVSFDVYQVTGGSQQANDAYEDSQYRIDVDLQPGEAKTYVGQYKLTDNGNVLTLMVADIAMPNGIYLGMQMAVKATDLTDVEEEYLPTKEEEATASISLDLPAGITVSEDFVKEYPVGDALVAPTSEQVTNTSRKEILGWYVKGTLGDPIAYVEDSVMEENGVTIAPILDAEEGKQLLLTSVRDQAGTSYHPDWWFNLDEDGNQNDYVDEDAGEEIADHFNGYLYIDENNYQALRLQSDAPFHANDFFRLVSKCGTSGASDGIIGGHTYKFDFNLHNFGTQEMKLKLGLVQGSNLISTDDGAVYSNELTIKPGETVSTSVTITLENNNANNMVFVQMLNEIDSLDLGITQFKTNVVTGE